MVAIRYRLRSFLRARWREVLVVALVVGTVGGGALTLFAGALRTTSAPERYSSWRGDLYDVAIEQGQGAPRTGELEALPSLTRVDAATFVFGGLRSEDGSDVDTLVFSGSDAPLGMQLVAGRLPRADHPGEFAVTQTLVDSGHARIGETYELVTLTQSQADAFGFDAPTFGGPRLEATLVGVLDGPGAIEANFTVALFPLSLLDQGDIGVSATLSVAALAPSSTLVDLRRDLDGVPGGATFSVEPAAWVQPDVRATVRAQGQGLLVLAAIVTVTAVIVLGQLLSRQFPHSDAEQAALYAQGHTALQVTGDAVARATVVAVGGTAAALAVAVMCSGLFPVGFAERVEPHPGRRFDLLAHGAGSVLFAVALLAWFAIAQRAARRPERSRERLTMVARLASIVSSPPAATALRFAFARRAGGVRVSRSPLVGLGLVLVILGGALTFGASLTNLLDRPDAYGVNFDVGLGAGGSAIPADVRRKLAESSDVEALTLYGTAGATVGTRSLDIVGMDPVRGDLVPEILDGRLPQASDEIAMGRTSARDLHAAIGDEISLRGAGSTTTMRMTGLVVVPSVEGVDQVGDGGVVTAAGFTTIDPSGQMSVAAADLSARPGSRDRVAELTGMAAGPVEDPTPIVNLRRVRAIPFLVAAAVALLGLLSLGHQMILVVRRRRRDISILRALGAGRRWISSLVHWQATVTLTVVLAVSLPLGVAAGSMLYRVFIERVGSRVEVLVSFSTLATIAAGSIVMGNLITVLPARRSRHLPIRELLEDA